MHLLSFFIILQFQSTPSVWRETQILDSDKNVVEISIHSLRVEGDGAVGSDLIDTKGFQSTPSVWRETGYLRKKLWQI